MNDTIYRLAAQHINEIDEEPAPFDKAKGLQHFDYVIDISQAPIGRTPRSNPATYSGVLTPIRELFAQVPEARARGYEPGRFSFNVKGGRCETCQGDGVIKVEMHFLPDVYVPCDTCHGKRYNRETLDIRYKGKNISEVLKLTVEDALALFRNVPMVAHKLETLMAVGLGYIELGQNATTLSRRRSAAREAREGAVEALDGIDVIRARRADDGPALPRHRAAARGALQAARSGQHDRDHRAQSRRDQNGGLDRRSRAGRRRGRRRDHRRRNAGGHRWRSGGRTPARRCRACCRAPAPAGPPRARNRLARPIRDDGELAEL